MDLRIVAISDQHGFLPDIPECDILVIAGDICPVRDHSAVFQLSWLDTNFRSWLNNVPAKHVVGCAGNHDFVFMTHPERIPQDLRWNYLECSSIELEGLNIWGSPWSKFFYDWAFNAPEHNGEKWLEDRIYGHMPNNTDIVITHGPPFGGREIDDLLPHGLIYGDYDLTVQYKDNPPQHVGSTALAKRLDVVKPLLTLTGHIHSGRCAGKRRVTWKDSPDQERGTDGIERGTDGIIANVSIVNEKYQNVYAPVEFFISDDWLE